MPERVTPPQTGPETLNGDQRYKVEHLLQLRDALKQAQDEREKVTKMKRKFIGRIDGRLVLSERGSDFEKRKQQATDYWAGKMNEISGDIKRTIAEAQSLGVAEPLNMATKIDSRLMSDPEGSAYFRRTMEAAATSYIDPNTQVGAGIEPTPAAPESVQETPVAVDDALDVTLDEEQKQSAANPPIYDVTEPPAVVPDATPTAPYVGEPTSEIPSPPPPPEEPPAPSETPAEKSKIPIVPPPPSLYTRSGEAEVVNTLVERNMADADSIRYYPDRVEFLKDGKVDRTMNINFIPVPPLPSLETPPVPPVTSPAPPASPEAPKPSETLAVEGEKSKSEKEADEAAKKLRAEVDKLPEAARAEVLKALDARDFEKTDIEKRYGDQKKLWSRCKRWFGESTACRALGGILKIGQGAGEIALGMQPWAGLFGPALFLHGATKGLEGIAQTINAIREGAGKEKSEMQKASSEIEIKGKDLEKVINEFKPGDEVKIATLSKEIQNLELKRLESKVTILSNRAKTNLWGLRKGILGGAVGGGLVHGIPTGFLSLGGIPGIANSVGHQTFLGVKGWMFAYKGAEATAAHGLGANTSSLALLGHGAGHTMGATSTLANVGWLAGGLAIAGVALLGQARYSKVEFDNLQKQIEVTKAEAEKYKPEEEKKPAETPAAPSAPAAPKPAETTAVTSTSSSTETPRVKKPTILGDPIPEDVRPVVGQEKPVEKPALKDNSISTKSTTPYLATGLKLADEKEYAKVSELASEKDVYQATVNGKKVYIRFQGEKPTGAEAKILVDDIAFRQGKVMDLKAHIAKGAIENKDEPAEKTDFVDGEIYPAKIGDCDHEKTFYGEINGQKVLRIIIDDLKNDEEVAGKNMDVKAVKSHIVDGKGTEFHVTIHHDEEKPDDQHTEKPAEKLDKVVDAKDVETDEDKKINIEVEKEYLMIDFEKFTAEDEANYKEYSGGRAFDNTLFIGAVSHVDAVNDYESVILRFNGELPTSSYAKIIVDKISYLKRDPGDSRNYRELDVHLAPETAQETPAKELAEKLEKVDFKAGETYTAKIGRHKKGKNYEAEVDGITVKFLVLDGYDPKKDGKEVKIIATTDSKSVGDKKQDVELIANVSKLVETAPTKTDKPEKLHIETEGETGGVYTATNIHKTEDGYRAQVQGKEVTLEKVDGDENLLLAGKPVKIKVTKINFRKGNQEGLEVEIMPDETANAEEGTSPEPETDEEREERLAREFAEFNPTAETPEPAPVVEKPELVAAWDYASPGGEPRHFAMGVKITDSREDPAIQRTIEKVYKLPDGVTFGFEYADGSTEGYTQEAIERGIENGKLKIE